MPTVHYPTAFSADGPFLLSWEALVDLDAIVSRHTPRLEAFRDEIVERERNAGKEHKAKDLMARNERGVVLALKNGARVTASSFEEAAAHPEVSQHLANGFRLDLRCGIVSATIDASTGWSTKIDAEVSPSSADQARALYSSFQQWVTRNSSPRWQRYWLKADYFPAMVAWIAWVCVAMALLFGGPSDYAKDRYREEAHRIIEKGITQQNQADATRVLLALASDYVPPRRRTSRAGGSGFFLWVGL